LGGNAASQKQQGRIDRQDTEERRQMGLSLHVQVFYNLPLLIFPEVRFQGRSATAAMTALHFCSC